MSNRLWYGDKGHGEKLANGRVDPGAVNGNLVEHTVNEVVADAWAERMRQYGETVILEPGDLQIGDSASYANSKGATHLLSFHENAGGGNRGESIFNWKAGAEELANTVALGIKNAGQTIVNVYKCPALQNGQAEKFGILRVFKKAGVIVECAFIDNAEDRQIIDTIVEQQMMGHAIADAICKSYGLSLPDNSQFNAAIAKLADAGIVTNDSYWVKSIANNTPISGEWMDLLLQKLAKRSNLALAVGYLNEQGLIGTPEYWLTNCVSGKTVSPSYVKILVPKVVAKLGL